MNEEATILSTALNDPVEAIAAGGRNPRGLLARALIDPDQPGEQVPLRAFVSLVETAADHLDAPSFGWEVGKSFHLENLGELGHAMRQAPTLGRGLRVAADSFAVLQRQSSLCLSAEDGEAVLAYRVLDPSIWPRRQDAELTLAVFLGLIRLAAGPDSAGIEMEFEHGPHQPQTAGPGSLCRVSHECEVNRILFPARYLDLPLPQADPCHFRALAGRLRSAACDSERELALPHRVRALIYASFGKAAPCQAEIATALGVSDRSLRRRLEAAGAPYMALLAECRARHARHRLANLELPLADLALELGYSEQSAFERAFRAQTGETPARYRRRLAGSGRSALGPEA